MAVPGIDFRFSNTADWTDAFAILVGADRTPPWVGTPEWAALTAYDVGVARVYGGDLYIAQPGPTSGPWTSTATFEADSLVSGASRWLLAGSAAAYARVPYDLTNKRITAALKACSATGDITNPNPMIRVGTDDGSFVVTNARAGGVAWAVPRKRARNVPAGLYRYDIVAQSSDDSVRRLRFGLILIDEGIVP